MGPFRSNLGDCRKGPSNGSQSLRMPNMMISERDLSKQKLQHANQNDNGANFPFFKTHEQRKLSQVNETRSMQELNYDMLTKEA